MAAAEEAANESESNAAQFTASGDSLSPKRDELTRMADALESALERRARVLRLSKNMHEQISQVSFYCLFVYCIIYKKNVLKNY